MQPPRPRILIVEDEPSAAELVADVLTTAGYDVESAEDGATALERLDADVDLMLLDVMLPGVDGFEVCRRVRAAEDEQHLPIIMLTALASDAQRHAGFAAGADDYLTKPFNTQELLDRVQVWLAARQRQKDARPPSATPPPAPLHPAAPAPQPPAPPPAAGSNSIAEEALRYEGLLTHLVAEATRRPGFLAAVLVPYAQAQSWDESELAAALGCPPAMLPRLLLRARPLPHTWDQDVATLADACGADAAAVSAVVRAAEAWEQGRS
ncbi:MAG TPA: response regulator [Chloroflexota bacterium]|nr:response regulator [Chloroflexota bacterium]